MPVPGRRLILLRHATAAGYGSGGDIDRALTPHGLQEATHVGQRLARQGFHPNQVLCSAALRCRQTWGQVALAFAGDKTNGHSGESTGKAPSSIKRPVTNQDADFSQRLYNASETTLLDAIAGVPDTSEDDFDLLLIAHNPGISHLAYALGRGNPEHEQRLRAGFAPATTALFTVSGPWSELAASRAEFLSLTAPSSDV